MKHITLSIRPKEAIATILKSLPNKRLRDVVERRFGIRGTAMTLDAIGKTYGITRERVRQIENDALRRLQKTDIGEYLAGTLREMANHLASYGGIAAYDTFVRTIADESELSHVELLVTLHPEIKRAPESDEYHPRVYIEKEKLAHADRTMRAVVQELQSKKALLSESGLVELVAHTHQSVVGSRPSDDTVASLVQTSRLVGKNSYNEYGLLEWPTIKPKSIRDKAYVVLLKSGKPLHFQNVALAIDQSGLRGKKKAHPQTVHNELIKDSNRFVLVGRGLYALREWGYEPGTVKDVITGILREENKALTKEMIVKAVMQRRFVKENTIMLNLQNRQHFKKNDNGAYYLA